MSLLNVLAPDVVWTDLRATTKEGVIEEMVDRLVATGRISARDEVLTSIHEREAMMSTGMQNGVAIPHGKTREVDELVAAVGLQRDGVDFDSMDGEPAKIFILTITPPKRVGPHIQFLAEISRLISQARIAKGYWRPRRPKRPARC